MAAAKKAKISKQKAHELLARERARIEKSLADLKHVRDSEIDEVSTETEATAGGEQLEEVEVDDAIARQLRWELEAVGRAEQRVEDDSYGLSIHSGEPIPAKRLEAVPWAERTAEEQAEHERTHGSPF
jgi:RNA polymerase-binding transcription factor